MAVVDRIRVAWTGLPGLPGVSTFYATDAAPMLAPLKDFFVAFAGAIPAPCTITVEESGEQIETTTGKAVGAWSTEQEGGSVVCTGESQFSAASGLVVQWTTGAFVAGRRVRGRTFIVPIGANNYDAGSLTIGILTPARAAAAALNTASAGNLQVLSQPFVPKAGDSRPARAGSAHPITGSMVPDLAAILRSRRD